MTLSRVVAELDLSLLRCRHPVLGVLWELQAEAHQLVVLAREVSLWAQLAHQPAEQVCHC
jgi:hypothetical protein